jgi:hypothetical protein
MRLAVNCFCDSSETFSQHSNFLRGGFSPRLLSHPPGIVVLALFKLWGNMGIELSRPYCLREKTWLHGWNEVPWLMLEMRLIKRIRPLFNYKDNPDRRRISEDRTAALLNSR